MAKQPCPEPRKGPITGKPKCKFWANGKADCKAMPTHEILRPNSIYPDEPHKDPYCEPHADVMLAFYNRSSNVAVKRPYVEQPLRCEAKPSGLLGLPRRLFGLPCGRRPTHEVFDKFGNSMGIGCEKHADGLIAFYEKRRNDSRLWREAGSSLSNDPFTAQPDLEIDT